MLWQQHTSIGNLHTPVNFDHGEGERERDVERRARQVKEKNHEERMRHEIGGELVAMEGSEENKREAKRERAGGC